MSYSDLYNAFDSDPAPTVRFLEWQAEAQGLSGPIRVLDVGCGPGRLLEPLSTRGWRVMGLEPHNDFYDAARRSAEALSGVEIRRGGFNDIEGVEQFEMVIGINSSFAHVLTPELRIDAVTRAHRALVPGGILILDLPNLLRILFEYAGPSTQSAVTSDGEILLTRTHSLDYHAATFTTHEEYVLTNVVGETRASMEHVYAIMSYPELRYSLLLAGFEEPMTFRQVDSRESESLGSGRMLIVARKPEPIGTPMK